MAIPPRKTYCARCGFEGLLSQMKKETNENSRIKGLFVHSYLCFDGKNPVIHDREPNNPQDPTPDKWW